MTAKLKVTERGANSGWPEVWGRAVGAIGWGDAALWDVVDKCVFTEEKCGNISSDPKSSELSRQWAT